MADEVSPRETPFIGHRQGDPPSQLALDDLLMDDTPSTEEYDPLDDPDNLNIDDLDPDTLGDGNPEDF
jgi:hypothetical protein